MITIELLPALSDNYIYLIKWNGKATVVDPGDPAPVREALAREGRQLSFILCTHHHADHIGGISTLKAETGCRVIGPNDPRIDEIDITLEEGESFDADPLHFEVLSVPGHTSIHLAYYFPEEKWLFSGDALFVGGCGRLFEGTPEQMWTSLSKIKELPDDTEIYCGHEYTLSNLRFAASIEPKNKAVAERLKEVTQLRDQGKPTIPSTLAVEKITNPFLRADDPLLADALEMSDASPVDRFAEIRSRKDNF